MKALLSFTAAVILISACNDTGKTNAEPYAKGSFGYDLAFLQKHDSVIVLSNADSSSQVIVSAKYQGKVFTSTAEGMRGKSFGWVHYSAFDGPADIHMNAYGGENRLWLGPEGGNYSLFFPPGKEQVFTNWKTPAAFDTESWQLVQRSADRALLQKDMQLVNYRGSTLLLNIRRELRLMNIKTIGEKLGTSLDGVKSVGYETDNILTNTGSVAWTDTTGMPCLWVLDMFPPSAGTTIMIPYDRAVPKPANTGYFGEIAKDRIHTDAGILYFKADGAARGKLGIVPAAAKNVAGSYDAGNQVLTIVWFTLDNKAAYLNQEWGTVKPAISGDAVNAYNDGPLADGKQMGPFYELESVSPAARLLPGQALTHSHSVIHLTGDKKALDRIAQKIFGVSLEEIGKALH
jgi:hypothetical protein